MKENILLIGIEFRNVHSVSQLAPINYTALSILRIKSKILSHFLLQRIINSADINLSLCKFVIFLLNSQRKFKYLREYSKFL